MSASLAAVISILCAHQMHLAALPRRVMEVLGDGLPEPSMLIRDHVCYALESALLEQRKVSS